jgi:hypothetical protein
MANQYTQVSITGYNTNPPDDDGSETEANRVRWSTIKTKITDPVKTRTDTMDTNIASAFGKIDGGVTSYSTDSSVASTDQGKLVRATDNGITITTPDATDVGAPFVFDFSNGSTGDVTLDGYSTQTIDGEDSIVVSAGAGLRVRTDGSNWFTTGQNFQRTHVQPQGYLTLLSVASAPLSPMPSSDQSAKDTVYYRPDRGNLVPVSDGTSIRVRAFSELSLTLNSNHVANGIYDVFLFEDSGTLTLGTGPVWNTVTAGSGARGTGSGTTELDVLNGLKVNKVAMTARNGSTTYSVAAKAGMFLGTIAIDASAGKVTCHVSYGQSRKWGISNAYNKRLIILKGGDTGSSWSYGTNTLRYSNADSTNSVTTLDCLPEEQIDLSFNQIVNLLSNSVRSSTTMEARINIGQNGVTSVGKIGQFRVGTSLVAGGSGYDGGIGDLLAQYDCPPTLGLNTWYCLEQTPQAIGDSFTYQSTSTGMLLKAKWMG